jgi:hypothetical protein
MTETRPRQIAILTAISAQFHSAYRPASSSSVPYHPRRHDKIIYRRRMISSGMQRRVDLVTADVSEESIVFITTAERISELGKTLAVTCNSSDTFLRNVSSYESHITSHPRRRHCSVSPPWAPKILHSINCLDTVAGI